MVVALVIGAAVSVVRGRSVRLWQDAGGTVWQRGSAATITLWLVALAAHVGVDLAVSGVKGAGSVTGASILLFIAVSFGLQREIVRWRASRLPASTPATGAPGDPTPGRAPSPGAALLGRLDHRSRR